IPAARVPCRGDSGAGLVTVGQHPVLVGVFSSGPRDCKPTADPLAAPEFSSVSSQVAQHLLTSRNHGTSFRNIPQGWRTVSALTLPLIYSVPDDWAPAAETGLGGAYEDRAT